MKFLVYFVGIIFLALTLVECRPHSKKGNSKNQNNAPGYSMQGSQEQQSGNQEQNNKQQRANDPSSKESATWQMQRSFKQMKDMNLHNSNNMGQERQWQEWEINNTPWQKVKGGTKDEWEVRRERQGQTPNWQNNQNQERNPSQNNQNDSQEWANKHNKGGPSYNKKSWKSLNNRAEGNQGSSEEQSQRATKQKNRGWSGNNAGHSPNSSEEQRNSGDSQRQHKQRNQMGSEENTNNQHTSNQSAEIRQAYPTKVEHNSSELRGRFVNNQQQMRKQQNSSESSEQENGAVNAINRSS